jgi:hypothetical protein
LRCAIVRSSSSAAASVVGATMASGASRRIDAGTVSRISAWRDA